jgi:hypothetical protein
MTRTLPFSHFFSFFYLFFLARARPLFIRAACSLSLTFPSLAPSQARLRTLCSCSLSKVSLLACLAAPPVRSPLVLCAYTIVHSVLLFAIEASTHTA